MSRALMKIEDWMEKKPSCYYGAQTSLTDRPLFFFAQPTNVARKKKKKETEIERNAQAVETVAMRIDANKSKKRM